MKIAVVGGGVIGLLSAYYLRRGGAEVVVLERERMGSGCSLGNGGWVCPSISTPLPGPGLGFSSLLSLIRPESPLYIAPASVPRLAGWLAAFRRHCNDASYARGLAALGALNRDTTRLYTALADDGVRFELRTDGMLLVVGSGRAIDEVADELRRLEP